MPTFRYEVTRDDGRVLRGTVDAPSSQEATRRLSERGYRVVQVSDAPAAGPPPSVAPRSVPVRPQTVAPSASQNVSAGASVAYNSPSAPVSAAPVIQRGAASWSIPGPDQLALFFRQMGSLTHAGFTLANALSDLGMRLTHRGLREASKEMGASVAGGASLAAQMACYPTLFPPHVIGLVHAGEAGGFVEFSFEEAALGMEQDAALRQGLWLPKFLWWQSFWSVLLMIPLFPSLDPDDIPGSARRYALRILLIMVPIGLAAHVLTAIVGWMRHQPFARDFFDKLSLYLPVMRKLAHVRAMAAFTRVLRRCLLSGVSVEVAYDAAVQSVPNSVLRNRLAVGLPLIRAGQGLDAAIAQTRMIGNDPMQLLITGQKTGQFTEMLDRVASFYQEEAVRQTEAARSAQKRAGVIITLVTSGYVMIAATYGLAKVGMDWTASWTKDQ